MCIVTGTVLCARSTSADSFRKRVVQRVLSPFSGPVLPVPMHPLPPAVYPSTGAPVWAGPAAPPFGPPLSSFLPAPFMPMGPVPAPFHTQPVLTVPAPAFAMPPPVTVHNSWAQPTLAPQTSGICPDVASEPVQEFRGSVAQPMSPQQMSATCPVILAMPASRPPPRRTAPAIITPPHPEGLKRLLEQRERDGTVNRPPVDKPRGPAVVTPMPSKAELARLHTVVSERNAVAAREHVRGLLEDAAQRWMVDGCPGGNAWPLVEQVMEKAAPVTDAQSQTPVIAHNTVSSAATTPSPVSVRTFQPSAHIFAHA